MACVISSPCLVGHSTLRRNYLHQDSTALLIFVRALHLKLYNFFERLVFFPFSDTFVEHFR
jgi:hypothetical protein